MPTPIHIADHDPLWPETFATLRDQIAGALGTLALGIEHVGSTAVPELPAKPIIDIDAVIASRDELTDVLRRLRPLGYHHEGDLGVPGREAFTTPPGTFPHHLYVCASDNSELARHLAFRDHLRAHPETADAYAMLKRSAARQSQTDRTAYNRSKTAFVREVLDRAGITA